MYVILDNGRIDRIFDIYKQFLYLYNEENKIKVIEILSSNELTENEKEKLNISLKKYYEGYEVIIHNKIDTKIIGGYHILVNGISVDLSFKRKIENLEKHVLN